VSEPDDPAPPDAAAPPAPEPAPPGKVRILVKRHSLAVRITHWVNVLSLTFLLLSGLNIFNAHPSLYWGQTSRFGHPWLDVTARPAPGAGDRLQGITTLGSASFDTTGVLGASRVGSAWQKRGFPDWLTVPSQVYLSIARRWHFFFAWLFALNGVTYLASGLIGGHLRRDLAPTRADLKPRHILREIVDHARLRFPKGEEARRYNVLQKGAYLAVILLLLPLMALTGMTMSPSLDATFPFLLDLFGGRQSARSIHFIVAWLLVGFVALHLVMVVVSGLWNNLRSMITGRYAIEVERAEGAAS
jgi:thiosulfate reductase cytochrome b subunit